MDEADRAAPSSWDPPSGAPEPPPTAVVPAVASEATQPVVRTGEDLPTWVSSRGPLTPHTVVVEHKRWTAGAKVTATLLSVLLVGALAGGGYAWWHERQDRQSVESDLNSAAATSAAQVTQLTKERDDAQTQFNAATQQLATANGTAADLQRQLTTAQADLKTAQTDRATALSETKKLQALFPVDVTTTAAGLPGGYSSTVFNLVSGGCSLAPCPLRPLRLTVSGSGASLVASDPSLGRVGLKVVAGAEWAGSAAAGAAFRLQCQGAPQPTTFSLALAPTAVALTSSTTSQVTILAGRLVLTSAAVTPPGATAPCPAGLAVYDLVAQRS
jgi:hypothetical protein